VAASFAGDSSMENQNNNVLQRIPTTTGNGTAAPTFSNYGTIIAPCSHGAIEGGR
jgi:hypothetical protein